MRRLLPLLILTLASLGSLAAEKPDPSGEWTVHHNIIRAVVPSEKPGPCGPPKVKAPVKKAAVKSCPDCKPCPTPAPCPQVVTSLPPTINCSPTLACPSCPEPVPAAAQPVSGWRLGGTGFFLPAQGSYGWEAGASIGPVKTLKSGWLLSPQLLVVHNEEGDGGVVSSKSGHHRYPYPGPRSDTRAGLLFSWTRD